MLQSTRTEMRRSSPVVCHVRHKRSAPRSSTTISEKYWLMTCAAGIRSNTALMTIGSIDVTAISTGRNTHHSAIQTAMPIAAAPFGPNAGESKPSPSTNATGPERSFPRFRRNPSIQTIPHMIPSDLRFYCRKRARKMQPVAAIGIKVQKRSRCAWQRPPLYVSWWAITGSNC